MGILSDVFVATDAELTILRPGSGGPEGIFATVPGKGIDPLKLADLEAIVIQHEADAEQSQPLIHGQLIKDWGEVWIYRFPGPLVEALTRLEPGTLVLVAERWAASEEWRHSGIDMTTGPDSLRLWLSAVCKLAYRAQHENRSMYLWLSL